LSYLVMARRWRPQKFSEVIGQDHVTVTLQQAIKRNRVAHAYIFTGPRGVGKTSCARLFAKAVNCPNVIEGESGLPEPCNDCPSCNDITAGNALDVIEIDGASNNKVEDVRTLRENIKYAPTAFPHKVYIIDEVHMLTQSAFNALLKTLEEPPDHAMFIFATTEMHKVPATVQSRCQRFDFKRIPTRGIRKQLETIVKADSILISEDALVLISVKAEGSLRDALSILDQLVAYQGEEKITGEIVRQALGLINEELFFAATDMSSTGNIAQALELSATIGGGGHDPREFLHGFQRHILDMLYIRAGGSPEELEVPDHFRNRYKKSDDEHTDEDLLRMAEWSAESEDLLRDALDPQLRLELFLVRIARMDRAVDIGALLEQMGVAPDSFKTPVKREPFAKTKAAKIETDDNSIIEKEQDTVEIEEKDTTISTPAVVEDTTAEDATIADLPTTGNSESVEDSRETVLLKEDDSAEEHTDQAEISAEKEDKKTESQPEVAMELTLQQLRERWLDICENINPNKRSLGANLEKGAPTGFDGKMLEITYEQDDSFAYDLAQRNREELSAALKRTFGIEIQVKVIQGEISEDARPPKRKTQKEIRQETFQDLLDERPVLKEMVERLDLKLEE